MELRHLRYFIAAAETENITRAALKLHVSQPALSRQVRDLEDELGFLLLERSAKSVRLTEAGRVFLTEARAVIQRVADGVQAARAVATGRGGEIHVGYAPSLTARILPPTLRAFQAALPGVRVKLHDLATEEMLSGLRAGRLQLSFLVKPDRGRLRGLRFEELARDSVRLALSPRHPLAQRRRVTLAEVANEPLIIYSREEYPEHYESVIALLATVKANPRVAEEHESVISLIAAVEAGTGVALVSESLSCIAGPRLKLTPLSPDPAPLVVGAAWSKQGLTSPANRFLEAAKEVAAKAMVNPEVS
jgi:DNA-binding transcriptional LysR family regulator